MRIGSESPRDDEELRDVDVALLDRLDGLDEKKHA